MSYFPRRKCVISYHKEDTEEVDDFIESFDNINDVFIYRALRTMDNNIVNSINHDYIIRRIRERYLSDSTVTIVLIGKCTWARKYVDWEIASCLRNDRNSKRSGLMAINLPSVAKILRKLPPRLEDNWDQEHDGTGYAKWYRYPQNSFELALWIEDAYEGRTKRSHLVDAPARQLFTYNRRCGETNNPYIDFTYRF